ncbi:MAG: HAD family phosphatase [Hespellia sp.]|nr:HAD family phosphatase [Hespellia sp.]
MVKNIVFDMGRVLIEYDPMKVCEKFVDEKNREEICTALFQAPEWIELDRGSMTEAEAMVIVKDRLPLQSQKDAAQACMDHWDQYNIWPKEGMREVVEKVKEQGFHIYLLSNASLRLRGFQQMIPGIDLFDGIMVSAEEKCIKPEPEIYHHLFEKFDLVPEECFFIDDVQANIDGAKACGMDGYCFADGDVERLKHVLEQLVD